MHGTTQLDEQPNGSPSEGGDRHPGLDRLRHAVHVFTAAERRLRGRYQRRGESLSHGHLRALFVLIAEDEVTAGRLARDAELNPASVTAMVDQLEAQGLVQRRRDDQDRRVCWISLTEQGRSEVAEKETRWRQRLAEAFADVPDHDLETASRVLERLALVFDMQEQEAEPRPGSAFESELFRGPVTEA
jgi:DNA-binding MarR family transcriptional regulator